MEKQYPCFNVFAMGFDGWLLFDSVYTLFVDDLLSKYTRDIQSILNPLILHWTSFIDSTNVFRCLFLYKQIVHALLNCM